MACADATALHCIAKEGFATGTVCVASAAHAQFPGITVAMNFTHLLAFFEVARAGSVSAGAERLRVSQPAVTREIRELEERLGLVLFDRLPRGVALTDAGSI